MPQFACQLAQYQSAANLMNSILGTNVLEEDIELFTQLGGFISGDQSTLKFSCDYPTLLDMPKHAFSENSDLGAILMSAKDNGFRIDCGNREDPSYFYFPLTSNPEKYAQLLLGNVASKLITVLPVQNKLQTSNDLEIYTTLAKFYLGESGHRAGQAQITPSGLVYNILTSCKPELMPLLGKPTISLSMTNDSSPSDNSLKKDIHLLVSKGYTLCHAYDKQLVFSR